MSSGLAWLFGQVGDGALAGQGTGSRLDQPATCPRRAPIEQVAAW
jgi:hypothetical protein